MGPDGIVRSHDHQLKLNEAIATLFRTPQGGEVLAYLRSITLLAICGPDVSDAGLRHREGMRHLVTIIEQRIEAHHREQLRRTPGNDTPINELGRPRHRTRRAP